MFCANCGKKYEVSDFVDACKKECSNALRERKPTISLKKPRLTCDFRPTVNIRPPKKTI